MAEKKITRKVISPSKKDQSGKTEESKSSPRFSLREASADEAGQRVPTESRTLDKAGVKESEVTEVAMVEEVVRPKKACFFCQSNTKPSYTDINTLRRFVNDRAKIVLRTKSNLCSKHQRLMTKQVKYARHLSLLPFIPKV